MRVFVFASLNVKQWRATRIRIIFEWKRVNKLVDSFYFFSVGGTIDFSI